MIKRFFYDFEFEEKSTESGITIDVISLGFVNEEKKGIYLINKDYDWTNVKNQWLIDNVKNKLYINKDAQKIQLKDFKSKILQLINYSDGDVVQLYGYYSAYDHVCLASCFGQMVDLPSYIPMFTNDLKQIMNEKNITKQIIDEFLTNNLQHDALADANWNVDLYKFMLDWK